MVSESKKNFNLKINSLDCGIIDKSVSEVLGNLGRIYLVFTGIHEMSRAGFLTAFREVPGHSGTRIRCSNVSTPQAAPPRNHPC